MKVVTVAKVRLVTIMPKLMVVSVEVTDCAGCFVVERLEGARRWYARTSRADGCVGVDVSAWAWEE